MCFNQNINNSYNVYIQFYIIVNIRSVSNYISIQFKTAIT